MFYKVLVWPVALPQVAYSNRLIRLIVDISATLHLVVNLKT